MATVEGEVVAADFQDWEVLMDSDREVLNSPNSDNTGNFEEIQADSEGMIRLDYFSLENDGRYAKSPVAVVDGSEEGSIESDNPSWIDPVSDSRYQSRNSGEFWSDSGSDRSDERKFGDFNGKNELGLPEYEKIEVGFKGIGKIEGNDAGEGKFDGKSEMGFEDSVKRHMIFEGLGESQGKDNDLAKFWSDSGSDGLIFGDAGKVDGGSKISGELGNGNASEEGNLSIVAPEEQGPRGEEKKGKVVWWKVPFEVLKFCVFRVSPVWSFSMAAALMGFIILGRRLYKMKHKTQSLKLKVAMDDKVSHHSYLICCYG
uniref:Uncharacterized protein n=1 Tax=Rhizophora mucronata TaxID=61149 RepID=A0A2P2JVM2_RHIMU